MSSACHRVFNTPELLESILLHITPPTSILPLQRVSQLFHTTITTSPTIQTLLILRSPSSPAREWKANPHLRDLFYPWFLIHATADPWSLPSWGSLSDLPWSKYPLRKAFLTKNATWRAMFFISPAPAQLSLARHVSSMGGKSSSTCLIASPPTMGLLYDITEAFLRSEQVSSFAVAVVEGEVELHLFYTVQCDPGAKEQDAEFRCEGVRGRLAHWGLEWVVGRKGVWRTDLTVRRGGLIEGEGEAEAEAEAE